MAKLLLNAEGKVLTSNDKVLKVPNNIYIPQVTNIQLSEQGVLSWEFDSTLLNEYNPTITYLINLNGTDFTSTTKKINLISYLSSETPNIITIKVKAVVDHYSNNKQETLEAYSLPAEYVKTLTTPVFEAGKQSAAANIVGHNVYVFGGFDNQNQKQREIYKFDIEAMTITKLAANFNEYTTSRYQANNNNVVVGSDIYLFGGRFGITQQNSIFKFDTLTETLSKLEVTLPATSGYNVSIKYGNNVYIFDGNSNNAIYKFNIDSQTITTLSAVVPYKYSGINGCLIGNYVYLFTNYTYCIKFDITTETISTIGKVINQNIGVAFGKGNNIYLVVDNSSNGLFVKFDTTTETTTKLSFTTEVKSSCDTVNYDNKTYLIGGYDGANGLKTIDEVVLE